MKNKSSGFVKLIVLLLVVIIALAYFQINLREIFASEAWKDNWEAIRSLVENIWDKIQPLWSNYVARPALWVWQNWILGWAWPLVSSWFENQK